MPVATQMKLGVSQPTGTWIQPSSSQLSNVQGFAVSASAACLSHMIHHPLYTLKSQMMYFGKEFQLGGFIRQSYTNPTGFLYRGMGITIQSSYNYNYDNSTIGTVLLTELAGLTDCMHVHT